MGAIVHEPSLLPFDWPAPLRAVACGTRHSVVALANGAVFAWGKNNSGELGLGGGFQMDMESVPRQIEGALRGVRVAYVAAGQHHACAVTEAGEVYSWGMATWTEPHLMTALQKQRVVLASCGDNFTAVVNDVGVVYTWCKGFRARRAGVLGHGETSDKTDKQPERVDALKPNGASGPVCQVACGSRHVIAVVGATP